MKSIYSFICTALLATSSTHAAIVITEVMSSSGHAGGSGNGDWFELYNTGATAVDLTGWSWDDNTVTPGSHSLGSISIAAGGYVVVVDENATLISNWVNDVWGITGSNFVVVNNTAAGFSGLGSGGDAINIYDSSSTLVTSVTFGTATAGSSFEWNILGNSLDVSVAGENGAYVALLDGNDNAADDNPLLYGPGSDIASPGSAVPEPGISSLLLLGAAAGILRRRR